jgi:hypothetical protein
MTPLQFSVCIGMDAMRACMGKPTRNFSVDEIVRWLRLLSQDPAA